MNRELSPFERWMVKYNIRRVKTDGLKPVVDHLRAQGYNRVADGVVAGSQTQNTVNDHHLAKGEAHL